MPAEPTFAEQMVTKIEAVLLANVGVENVSFDGTSVSYADLTKQYDFWKRKVAKEKGTKPRVSTIDLRCS